MRPDSIEKCDKCERKVTFIVQGMQNFKGKFVILFIYYLQEVVGKIYNSCGRQRLS